MLLFDQENKLKAVAEVTNINLDKQTKNYLKENARPDKVVMYWRDENQDNPRRLYQSIEGKVTKYRKLIEVLKIPYVVCVFIKFEIEFDDDEIEMILNHAEDGIFNLYSHLSGLLVFSDNSNIYNFKYYKNENATNPFEIEDGKITF